MNLTTCPNIAVIISEQTGLKIQAFAPTIKNNGKIYTEPEPPQLM